MSAPMTFTRARAWSGDVLCVAGSPDDDDPFTPFTRLYQYRHGDPGSWSAVDLDVAVTSIARAAAAPGGAPAFHVLSAEGDVALVTPAAHALREKIAGAGIASPDAQYWGRMNRLRPIGDHLYACGDGGQVYRRDGADLGSGRWHQLDPSLLQTATARAAAMQRDLFSPEAQGKFYFDVDGPREDEIYVCGTHGTILAWDGASFETLPPILDATLVEILVEDAKSTWICGREGALIRGNRRDGFSTVAVSGQRQLFCSMTWFDGKLYLASGARPRGLFAYQRGRITQVSSGLSPDIDDAHTVEGLGGALWVVGSKDILRFDGRRWERIPPPP